MCFLISWFFVPCAGFTFFSKLCHIFASPKFFAFGEPSAPTFSRTQSFSISPYNKDYFCNVILLSAVGDFGSFRCSLAWKNTYKYFPNCLSFLIFPKLWNIITPREIFCLHPHTKLPPPKAVPYFSEAVPYFDPARPGKPGMVKKTMYSGNA